MPDAHQTRRRQPAGTNLMSTPPSPPRPPAHPAPQTTGVTTGGRRGRPTDQSQRSKPTALVTQRDAFFGRA